MSYLSARHGWDFEYIETHFTFKQLGLLYFLARRDEIREQEQHSKLVAGHLALILEKAGLLQRM